MLKQKITDWLFIEVYFDMLLSKFIYFFYFFINSDCECWSLCGWKSRNLWISRSRHLPRLRILSLALEKNKKSKLRRKLLLRRCFFPFFIFINNFFFYIQFLFTFLIFLFILLFFLSVGFVRLMIVRYAQPYGTLNPRCWYSQKYFIFIW